MVLQLQYEEFVQDFVGLTLQEEEIRKLFIAVDIDMTLEVDMMELCGFIWDWHPNAEYEEDDLVVHITDTPDLQDVDLAGAFITGIACLQQLIFCSWITVSDC